MQETADRDGAGEHAKAMRRRRIRRNRRTGRMSVAVVAAWTDLPEAIEAGIVAMVRAASGSEE